MSIANRIKAIAKEKGIKMETIYSSIGMTNAGFYRMLKNNSMKIDTVGKIAEVLGVSVLYLLQDLEEEAPNRPSENAHIDSYLTYEVRVSASRWTSLAFDVMSILNQKESLSREEILELLSQALWRSNKLREYVRIFDKNKIDPTSSEQPS